MAPPSIQLFLTTIASQPALRQRQGILANETSVIYDLHILEYLLRVLQVKKIPFTSYDLASDEEAKRLWKRKAPLGQNSILFDCIDSISHVYDSDKQQLPGILVGGRFPGVCNVFLV